MKPKETKKISRYPDKQNGSTTTYGGLNQKSHYMPLTTKKNVISLSLTTAEW